VAWRSRASRAELGRLLLAVAFGIAVGVLVPRAFEHDVTGTLAFAQHGGDVWGDKVEVRGTATGCDAPSLRVCDRDVTARSSGDRFVATVPLARGENVVRAECGGARDERKYLRRDTELPPPAAAGGRPAWIDDAVVYAVVPRSFGSTGGFGDVTARLGDLADLGVTAIWLSPSNRTVTGDFGYAVTDYFRLRPDYGTEADFRELVRKAHAHGIRVLMDFVPNHTSSAHPYFKDAAVYERASRYWSFYDRDESGAPTNYFDWTNLPNLNYDNPEVRRMITEAFVHWVRDFDVDGFRVDVAWGLKERAPDYWPQLREQLEAVKPGTLLIAEASARDPYYFSHGYDAAYDWTDELGHWAWDEAWAAPDAAGTVRGLREALSHTRPGHLVFRFLNNNDTGASFVSKFGTDVTRVAAAMLLTLPGIPCVYTGEEVGASFSPYVDSGAISWRDRYALRGWYKALIELRKRLPSLHAQGFRLLAAPAGVLAYVRSGGGGPALVVLNYGDEPVEVSLDLPAGLHGTLHDELGGGTTAAGKIALEAYGARVLVEQAG
jgi:cyclomaltodextrinase / maltogenic alpha-amylase / neopullulanase